MTRNQPKAFQNGKTFPYLNNVTLAEQPSKLMRQTLVSTWSLRVESPHTLCTIAVGLLLRSLSFRCFPGGELP